MSFVWLNVGYAAMIAALCAKRKSMEAWRAFEAGRDAAVMIVNQHTRR